MRWFEHCQVSLFGEDGEVGPKDQRKGMQHVLSQAVSCVSVWAFYVFVSVG